MPKRILSLRRNFRPELRSNVGPIMVKAVRMVRILSEISLPGAGGCNPWSNIWVVGRIGYSLPDCLRTYQACGILNTVSLNSDLQPETFPVEPL